jgi:hypothetical protein
MGTIAKELSFMKWVNAKYREELKLHKTAVLFYEWDDYALFLYYDKCHQNDQIYYEKLEDDIKEYVDAQKDYWRVRRRNGKKRCSTQKEN